MLPRWPVQSLDLLLPPAGGLHVAAQHVDLGAAACAQPVVAVRAARWSAGRSAPPPRLCARGTAAPQAALPGQDSRVSERCPGRPGGRPSARAAPPRAASSNLPEPAAGRRFRAWPATPRPCRPRTASAQLPARAEGGRTPPRRARGERVIGQRAGQDAGDQRRGAGRFGDLQRPGR